MDQLIKIVNPINKLKNKGIILMQMELKILKFSSNVKEFVIQDIPLK